MLVQHTPRCGEGKKGNFCLQRNFSKDMNEITMKPDSQLDDSRYRCDDLEHLRYFELMMGYEKFKETQKKSPREKIFNY